MARSVGCTRFAIRCQLGLHENLSTVLDGAIRLAQGRSEPEPLSPIPRARRRLQHSFLSPQGARAEAVAADPDAWLAGLGFRILVLGNGKALRYGIGVGREGFTWSGTERISRTAKWPDWNPPAEMIERQPYLPRFMAGGEGNPLGARALYLGNTIYRIHGTNQPSTIGTFVSSGCIRLTNDDIVDLHGRVQVGTRVVVLPGRPPATASAAPVTAPGAASVAPGAPPALIGHLAPPAPLAPPPGR